MSGRNRSTRSGGNPLPKDPIPVKKRRRRMEARRTLCALVELARSRRQLQHVPTRMQLRALAHFEGREPSSYLLDPKVNFVPELPAGGEDPLGRHALRFTGEDADSGRQVELVALPDGGAFDLLGMSG